jgi:hypothetical protein
MLLPKLSRALDISKEKRDSPLRQAAHPPSVTAGHLSRPNLQNAGDEQGGSGQATQRSLYGACLGPPFATGTGANDVSNSKLARGPASISSREGRTDRSPAPV